MKTHLILLALLMLAVGGCANQTSTERVVATGDGANEADPSVRTHYRNDLQNTGRHDSADALSAADPSVTVSSGRR